MKWYAAVVLGRLAITMAVQSGWIWLCAAGFMTGYLLAGCFK
jgi:hypothetical protein